MDKAAAKGARSSLVLMDRSDQSQVGLVVSIPNRTVITAVDTQSLKDNIFTNIDSAMII
jgi:flagellar operon protein